MEITTSIVRGVHATAATLIPADDVQAEPRHLREAVSKAVSSRYGDEAFSDQTKIRRRALNEAPEWSCRWTRKDLTGELHRSGREGLDLAELVGARYAVASARIWGHGSYSSSRVMPGLPQSKGCPTADAPGSGSGWTTTQRPTRPSSEPRTPSDTGHRPDSLSGRCPPR